MSDKHQVCATFPSYGCQLGSTIGIKGVPYGELIQQFSINLQTDCEHAENYKPSIAFHLNARFHQGNVVVLNSRNSSLQWGNEQRSENFPFVAGQLFKIVMVFEEMHLKVIVNGKDYCSFQHRIDFKNIRQLHISGDISVEAIEFRKNGFEKSERHRKNKNSFERSFSKLSVSSNESKHIPNTNHSSSIYPCIPGKIKNDCVKAQQTRNPKTAKDFQRSISSNSNSNLPGPSNPRGHPKPEPFTPKPERTAAVTITSPALPYKNYDRRFGKDFNLYLSGYIPPNFTENFVVNFSKTCNPNERNETNPFHLSVRPNEGAIVRNTKINGVWQNEERQISGAFPFIKGTYYDLMISKRTDKITVLVNGQFIFNFRHRLDPTFIDSLEIKGSTLIKSMKFEFL